MEDLPYPNRLCGLLEFAPSDDEVSESGLPSKAESLKRLLQVAKETIFRNVFS